MVSLFDLPHSDPMSGTDPEYFVKDGLVHVLIHQISNQLPAFPVLLDLEVLDSAVVPPRHAFLPLQRNDEHIYVVISSEEVFVGIDYIIRQRVTDFVEVIFGVTVGSEDVIDAVQSTKQRNLVLSLKVLSLHSNIFILIPNKYICISDRLSRSSSINFPFQMVIE